MKGRRFLAGIVGLAMLTSAFSFGVFADENDEKYSIINNISKYESVVVDDSGEVITSSEPGEAVHVRIYVENDVVLGEPEDKTGLVPELFVTAADSTSIEVDASRYKNFIFSFIMPAQDVTITAEYKPAIVPFELYQDVSIMVDGKSAYCAKPGETVTLIPPTLDGARSYDFEVTYRDDYSNHYEVPVTEENGCVTFTMPERFVVVTAIPRISGYQMLLTGAFELKYRVAVPEGYDPSSASITFEVGPWDNENDEYSSKRTNRINLSEETMDEYGTYWVTLTLNPLELGDTITATLAFGNREMKPRRITAMDYLNQVRANTNDESLISLVNRIQDYSAVLTKMATVEGGWKDDAVHDLVYQYSEEDDLLGALQDIDDVIEQTEKYAIKKENAAEAKIDDVKISLTMHSMNVVNIYVKPAEGTEIIDGYVQTVNILGSTYYQYDSKKLTPTELGDDIEFTIRTSDGEATVTASALSYVHVGLKNNRAASEGVRLMKNLALILYWQYYQAAVTYQAAH